MHFNIIVLARKGVDYRHLIAQYDEEIDNINEIQRMGIELENLNDGDEEELLVPKVRIYDSYYPIDIIMSKKEGKRVEGTLVTDVDWNSCFGGTDLIMPDGERIKIERIVMKRFKDEMTEIEDRLWKLAGVKRTAETELENEELVEKECSFYTQVIKEYVDKFDENYYIVALRCHM